MDEIEKIRQRYNDRKSNRKTQNYYKNFYFCYFLKVERELKYIIILRNKFDDLSKLKVCEIGAGGGDNLLFFHRLGIPWENIWANELLEDRGEVLKKNLPPNSHVDIDNALDLSYKDKFDIVFQSTVFTSILDNAFKQKLAVKVFDMVKRDGIVLWYDFKFNNPWNKDVKGINRKEIKQLFPFAKSINFHNVTLASPIGRRVGKLYYLINTFFPFLRTHLIAVITK